MVKRFGQATVRVVRHAPGHAVGRAAEPCLGYAETSFVSGGEALSRAALGVGARGRSLAARRPVTHRRPQGKDRTEKAHGGLLRKLGGKGILLIKDFTSILEMDRTARGQVLAALREIYDGRWDRGVGTDGGQTLTWEGKCGFLAGCTTAIDKAHAVMNDMGPRSLFVRLPPASLDKIAGSALDHMGREAKMREELAAATAGLLANLTGRPHDIDAGSRAALIGLANLVSQARSPVHRDWKGEIELVGDAEAPTRIIKQLGQLWRACGLLGLGRAESWEVVRRCALDSIPKLRGKVIRYLASRAEPADTTAVGLGVVHPSRTVRRALEDLAAHGVLDRKSAGQGHADTWELSVRARAWADATDTLPEMLEPLIDDGTCAEHSATPSHPVQGVLGTEFSTPSTPMGDGVLNGAPGRAQEQDQRDGVGP